MGLRVGVTLALQSLVHAVIWLGLWYTGGVVGAATAAWLSVIWHLVSRDAADLLLQRTRICFVARRGAVIVTGAGRGLGKAAVVSLIREGYHVIATIRDLKTLAELKKQINAPERLLPVAMDVASDESVKAGAEQIKILLKQHDIPLVGLINNAGIATHGPIEAVPISEFDRVRNVNVDGIVRCLQAFLPLLRSSAKSGLSPRVLNISSVAGFVATPYTGAYGCSKHAVEGLTDALRREVSSQGIGVVCVEPGFVESDMPEMLSSGAGLSEALAAVSAAGLTPVYDRHCTTNLSAGDVMYQEGKVPASYFGDKCAHIMTVANGDLHTRYLVGRTLFIRVIQRFFPDTVTDSLTAFGPVLAKWSTVQTRTTHNKQQ